MIKVINFGITIRREVYINEEVLKSFFTTLFLIILAVGIGVFTFIKIYSTDASENEPENIDKDFSGLEEPEDEKDPNHPLQESIENSKRVNFVLIGMQGRMTDTIIFASFDPETKKLDMISIPRDTYFHRTGGKFDAAAERKINAIYNDHGIEGLKKVVETILEFCKRNGY